MAKQGSSKSGGNQSVNLDFLRKAMEWVFDGDIFQSLKKHGNANWVANSLAMLAVLWVWSNNPSLTGAFEEARAWSKQLFGSAAVCSYQVLTTALVTYGGQLIPMMWSRLHRLMEHVGGEHWRIGRWLPLAVDGSRVSTPRTKANEKAFRAPNYGNSKKARSRKKKRKNRRGKKKQADAKSVTPQIWITLLWHMSMRLPWSWKLGPSNSSERDHFKEMLREQKFPKDTLFCGDAGFTGYDLWKLIIDEGHSFLIRIGSNVRLLTKLGYYVREHHGIVYVWPDSAARQNQPPLILRLIHLKGARGDVYLLTNALNSRHLTDAQAARMYRLRWGIELQFRTLKQTFGRRKLRSRTPDRAYAELAWSLIGLWIAHLFAVKEQITIGEPPSQTSAAMAIQVIRKMLLFGKEIPEDDEDMTTLLQQAVVDSYDRTSKKQGRYNPRMKDKPSAGKPEIIRATAKHKRKLKHYKEQLSTAA